MENINLYKEIITEIDAKNKLDEEKIKELERFELVNQLKKRGFNILFTFFCYSFFYIRKTLLIYYNLILIT